MLRCITYLSPSLPLGLFEAVADLLGRALGVEVGLRAEPRTSGPMAAADDPFAAGEADLAFLCTPSLLWLSDRCPRTAELVPAAFAFEDPRAAGRAVYFSELVVPREHPATSFEDLEGGRVAFNDPCSLSGYFNLLKRTLEICDCGASYFGELTASGSHLASLDLIRRGAIDAAAIDSNVLAMRLREEPELAGAIRVLESWGPYPVQPIVVSTAMPLARRRAIAEALLGADRSEVARRALAPWGVRGFAPIDAAAYEAEREALAACERLV